MKNRYIYPHLLSHSNILLQEHMLSLELDLQPCFAPGTLNSIPLQFDRWEPAAGSVCWVNSYFSALQLCPFGGCPPLPAFPSLEQVWFGLGDTWSLLCCFLEYRGYKFHRQEIPTIVWDKESFTQPQFFLPQCNSSVKTPVSEKISFWIDSINSFWYRTWIYLGFGLWIKFPVVPVPTNAKCITGNHPSQKTGSTTLSSLWDHSPAIPNLVGNNLCPISAVRARTWWIFILSHIGHCLF